MANKPSKDDAALSQTKEKQLQNILEAAEQCFIEQGIALTTMKDIAQRADIYRRTLYNYFQSKEDVAFAIHQKYNEVAFVYSESEVGSGYEQLHALLHDVFDHLETFLPYIRFEIQYEFFMHGTDHNEAYIKAGMNQALIHAFKTVLTRGLGDKSLHLPDPDVDMTVYALLQMVIGYLQRVVHRETIFVEEVGFSRKHWEIAISVMLRGLKA